MAGATRAAAGLGRVETRRVVLFDEDDPLRLACGETLAPVEVAYETYGELDADAGNAVYVLHALTGDAHAAGHHGDPMRRGWWDTLIGPGRPLDSERHFIICSNLLGGCTGTTGPSSRDPRTGRAYGSRFPELTVSDLVAVHRRLARRLGVLRPLAVIGGSLGGMQALQWAIDHPRDLRSAIAIGASARLSAQNIAFSAVGRAAIERDPDFAGGDYYERGRSPDAGLAVARMAAHITYLSEAYMEAKFGRRRQPAPGGGDEFSVEGYLRHQGESFVGRFDANTYLLFSRLMDDFEPFADAAAAVRRLRRAETRFLIVSFTSDWRFGRAHSDEIARVLREAGLQVRRRELDVRFGHDSFLLNDRGYHDAIAGFLADVEAGRL